MSPEIGLPVRRFVAVLAGALVVVVLLSIPAPFFLHVLGHDYVFGFVPFAERAFDLNVESNIPTWFSSSILFISSVLLLCIGLAERALKRPRVRHWLVLSGIFLYMSMDEAATIHEEANVLGDVFGLGGVLFYSWVILGAALVVAVGISYIGFLRALPARTRNLFLLSGAIFVGGALGLELFQGYYADTMGEAYLDSARRVVLTHVEETMEMGGVVLFIYALLDYARIHIGSVRIALESSGNRAAAATAPPRRRASPERKGRQRSAAVERSSRS